MKKQPYQSPKWLVWLALFVALPGFAQTPPPRAFSLREAVEFAVRENINVRNTQLDALSAEARIREIKAQTLPQINASGSLSDNLIIPTSFLPANVFDRTAPVGQFIPAKFGTTYTGNGGVGLNQLLFDASYKVGLKAASVLRELSQKNTAASKITVAEQVSKAYYSVLISEERAKLLNSNIGRLDTLLRETSALNKQGFVEKIDVQRLEVQRNNLIAERQNVQNLIGLTYALLNFQMGLPIRETITLTDRVPELTIDALNSQIALDSTMDYNRRIEYSQLQSQLQLAALDLENTSKQYYPRLMASANYGYSTGRGEISQLITQPWFALSAVSINFSMPIFDGYAKRYRTQQQRFTLQKAQNSSVLLKNTIDLQVQQARITTTNGLQSLRTQQRNRELAQEILRITRIKYKEGVGSNIEVLNAESSSREAQTNYFAALLDFMLAKVDLDKAAGILYKE